MGPSSVEARTIRKIRWRILPFILLLLIAFGVWRLLPVSMRPVLRRPTSS